jgi:hypothetical protein
MQFNYKPLTCQKYFLLKNHDFTLLSIFDCDYRFFWGYNKVFADLMNEAY